MESVSNSKKTYGQVFAERLTILCKERGFYSDNSIMQNDLAAELGASPSTINRYATGMRLPDPMYLIKFSYTAISLMLFNAATTPSSLSL